MSYTALYRKLRPETFEEIIGQEHIVKILTNQIINNRVSHAYLFCGTRGTGKTSTAKVFAKALNCESPNGYEPCNRCESCLNAGKNNNLNIVEIDAASNNGVDNIRDIKEEVRHVSINGKNTIYIIDEVHMLSQGAFNALLKTLEEPPEHVIFILATTDPQKIPLTILSRCQRLDFNRISAAPMAGALKHYMEKENINIEEKAIHYITRICDGAMRDALSLLDQVIAYFYGEDITLDMVLKVTGSVDNQVFLNIILALNAFDATKAIEIINQAVDSGKDIHQFVNDLIVTLRNLLVSLSTSMNTMDMSDAAYEDLKEKAGIVKKENLINYINDFSLLQSKMKYSQNPIILLETQCIKITNPESGDNHDGERLLERFKKMMEDGNMKTSSEDMEDVKKNINSKPIKVSEKKVSKKVKDILPLWDEFIDTELNDDMMLKTFLKNKSYLGIMEGEILYIVTKDTLSNFVITKEDIIREKINDKFDGDYRIKIMDEKEYDEIHSAKFGALDENKNKLNVNEINHKLGGFTTLN